MKAQSNAPPGSGIRVVHLDERERMTEACRKLVEAWDAWASDRLEPDIALNILEDSIAVIRAEVTQTAD